MKLLLLLPLLLPLLALGIVPLAPQEQREIGFDDTPFLPGGKWHVHDGARPLPPVVTPGIGAAPPADAIVLFDGSNLDAWQNEKGEGHEKWTIVDGVLEVKPDAGSLETVQHFGDVQLHLEWASPAVVRGDGQGRGNSGVFLMGLYEVQVLDSFENVTYADGQAGALYGQEPPLVNASRGPGEWQSYDILFRAPVFADGELVSPAMVTVLHNGVAIHHAAEFLGEATYRKLPVYRAHPATGPLRLQDHWTPVRYRNIWIRPLGDR